MLGRMLGAAGQAAAVVAGASVGAAAGVVQLAASAFAPRGAWSADGRVHLAVRGVQQEDGGRAAACLERVLTEQDGVHRAEVNAVLGRVLIEHDPERLDVRQLVELLDAAEQTCGLAGRPGAGAGPHPAAPGPALRSAVAVGVNLFGLGYATVGRAVPLPAFLPAPTLVSLVDGAPWLRERLEALLGAPVAEAGLSLTAAAANVAARRPLGLLVDMVQQFSLYQEATARRRAWERWERGLADQPGAHRAAPVPPVARPAPVPRGPVELVGNISALTAAAGYVAALAGVGSAPLASAIMQAGVPRAARAGQEGFAAQVDRDAGARGSLVLDPRALRRMDRVDTVVVDSAVLLTGRWMVEDVLPLASGSDRAELFEHTHDLVDTRRPGRRRSRAGWSIEPVGNGLRRLPAAVRDAVADHTAGGARVLALRHGARTAALVVVVEALDPLAEAVVVAARRAGIVLISSSAGRLERRLAADGVVDDAAQSEAIRGLQRAGRVVALVGGPDAAALAAADVGIGLAQRGRPPPWTADVLCRSLGEVGSLLDAISAARRTSRRCAGLSVAASGAGVLLAVLGPPAGAQLRASIPVHLTGLLALGLGTWSAMATGRLPQEVLADQSAWHAMSPQAVLESLGTKRTGLDPEEVRRRFAARALEHDGEEPIGLGRATMDELANPITPALAAGAGLSASAGSILDPVLIGTVLALNALVGGVQQVTARRSLQELTQTSAAAVRVRRSGTVASVRPRDLVVGDVVELRAGDAVPADVRLLSDGNGLEIDESSLTGESAAVAKSVRATIAPALADRHSMLYEGTVVAAGRAVGVVVATGEQTEAGRALRAARGDVPATGVELRMRTLTGRILPISVIAGLALIPVDLLRRRPLGQALGRGVSLAVAAVPEGLPFVATVAELAATRRLSARGALVRNPSTIEALGRVDVLCFDKTGTLTEGRITLRGVSDGTQLLPVDRLTRPTQQVLAAAVRASSFDLEPDQVFEPTDRALAEGARQAGLAVEVDRVRQLDELPFASDRAYHATLWQGPNGRRISVKGAPEVVLPLCATWWRDGDGSELDAAARTRLGDEVERLARRGNRILAVAEGGAQSVSGLSESDVRGLELRGLVALADPVRATAARAVATLRAAGVEVVMLTGDHPSTAGAVAAELGALNGDGVLTGGDVGTLGDDELDAALRTTAVFARVTPVQKARIVRRLQATGHAVAVTGDGTNDAPAIRHADVGLALGARATPAAREAADVVITDDRIETITDAIVEGRGMWSSVRDALSILLGGNLGEIAYTFGTALAGGAAALNARQLLLVNLLTDVLPAMSVAVRPPAGTSAQQLLEEGPEASLGSALTQDIVIRAAITAIAACVAWLTARPVSTPGQASTTGLVALVGAQLGQTLVVRGRTPLVLAAVVVSWLLLVAAVQLPGISRVVGSRPLLPHQWGIAVTASAVAAVAQLLAQVLRNHHYATRTAGPR